MIIFKDRAEAGHLLAQKLKKYFKNKDTVVLGLPRGGVITANIIAKELDLPLDIIIVKKISDPANEELALGAIAEDGTLYWDEETLNLLSIPEPKLMLLINKQKKLIAERIQKYRQSKPWPNLFNKTVILVDDGIATGSTMIVAINCLQKHKCKKVIVAVPVAPPDTLGKISKLVDDVIYLEAPSSFGGVGNFYRNFTQVTDDEVLEILKNR